MGQQLFKVNFDKINEQKDLSNSIDIIQSCSEKDNISYLFPWKITHILKHSIEIDNDNQITNSQKLLIKQIRNNLFQLTNFKNFKEINDEINEILENVYLFIQENYERAMKEIEDNLEKQEQLQKTFIEKLKQDEDEKILILSKLKTTDNKHEKISYFAIRSLISIILILIKSAEKNDSTIINEIISLTCELTEQMPMRYLSSLNNEKLLFKSLKPLINYIEQLSLSSDLNLSQQATQILLSFSIAKASFKDILPLLSKLIFDTKNIYHVKNLIQHLNDDLTETIEENKEQSLDETSLNYLKSIGVYPNSQLMELDDKQFTGQFISSIIFAHIHFDNEIHLNKSIKYNLLENSFSFDFHQNTFKQLFYIIEQLIDYTNPILNYIRIVCIRLFRTHLQCLFRITTNIYENISLITSKELELTTKINFISIEELNKWYKLFLKLSLENFQEKILCEDISKSLIYIIDKQTKTFIEKLSLIKTFLIENSNEILIKEFLFDLKQNVTLLNWINILLNENSDQIIALDILYSFIQIYLDKNEKDFEKILISFQHLLLFKFIELSRKQIDNNENLSFNSISSFIIQYINYIFNKCSNDNELFQDILIGLCLMTKINEIFHFEIIQPIITAILPLLSEYLLKNSSELIYWLLGKFSQIMIENSSLNSLEKLHLDQLNSLLFSGGYETLDIQSTSDYQLLFSIYNNQDEGAKLITKIKKSFHKKEYFLQKSIEEQSNNACASIFSVYIKYFRRLNLVKNDLFRLDKNENVHKELISLYKYSNSVQQIFANRKAQGEDCDQFYQNIRNRCLFLLLNIKENNFIPIIEENFLEKKITFQRQISHWTKAKHVIRLLRNLFHACIRFKKLILPKKNQLFNYQENLHENIQKFLFHHNYQLDQLKQSLQRQNQRTLSRLFIYQFIENNINFQKNNLFLIQLINFKLEWSYLENISTANEQLKNSLRKSYYSIIKNILLSSNNLSEIFIKIIFNLVNLDYQLDDLIYLYEYEIVEILLKSFVSFIDNSEENVSLEIKFLAFNWFRLFTLKLSEISHINQLKDFQNDILKKLNDFIFQNFIYNHLKELNQILFNETNDENSINSLEHFSIAWFIYLNKKTPDKNLKKFFSKYEIELCLNQFLILLLECIYLYDYIKTHCSNINYIEELLNIYYSSKHNHTKIILLKLLSELIPCLSNKLNNNSIEKFFNDSLIYLSENYDLKDNLINEIIYFYRKMISNKSSWQYLAIEYLFNLLNNENFNDKLIASLCILGGYIQPFCLTSFVKIYHNQQEIDKYQRGILIEIDSSSYVIQYLNNNQIEQVKEKQLEIEHDNHPLNLLLLPNSNELIDLIFNKLINLIENSNDSYLSLQIKRRSILSLYYLLNNQKLIEIFIKNSYGFILSKLTIFNLKQQLSMNLFHFNQQYLEQYSLNLKKNIEINFQRIPDENLIHYLSTPVQKYHGWKPYVTKQEYQLLNQGRLGNNDMLIVPMPKDIANSNILQECGNKHRFKGKIYATSENCNVKFPTFVIEKLRVKEGNWYYCVKLSVAHLMQIGWATDGFSPGGAYGVGDDLYSWSYDGSRSALFYNQEFSNQFDDIRWKENDILGCGISINQEDISIKYWLNGKLLGKPFVHQQNISSSSTKCNLLPHGNKTSFFPSISLRSNSTPPTTCEFIFSPEDMEQCPLPNGYKPLLMPKIINIENTIVPYPYSAYLIENNSKDYLYKNRQIPSKIFLRDFINNNHLPIDFNLDEHNLILTENSFGLSLLIDHNLSSFSMTFDYQILTSEQNNIQLLTIDILESFSIEIPFNKKIEKQIQIVIIFYLKEQQIKVYNDNQYQLFNIKFPNKINSNFNIYLLPKIHAKISNLAIWKYALSDEYIQRLFTYGIFYVGIDYQQLKEHEKHVQHFTFIDNKFPNEYLFLSNPIFNENPSKYIQSSILKFYGNKTYLILEKLNEYLSEYTIILDIRIPNWPRNKDQQLSLIHFNSQAYIYITYQGKLCIHYDDQLNEETSTPLNLNEFIRLFIIVNKKCLSLCYGSVIFSMDIDNDQFAINLNQIELFKELDLTKNTTNDDIIRIECQSITLIDQCIDKDIKIANSSLEKFILPSFSMIATNLIAIGYKESWIKYVIEQYQIKNIQMIDTILREEKEKFLQMDLENEQKLCLQIFSRLNSTTMNKNKLENYLINSNLNINEQINFILTNWNDFQIINQNFSNEENLFEEEDNQDKQWFRNIVYPLNIQDNINQWIEDKSNIIKSNNHIINSNQRRRTSSWFDDDDDDDDDDTSESLEFSHRILPFTQAEIEKKSDENMNQYQEDNIYKLYDLTEEKFNNFSLNSSHSNNHLACEYTLIRIYARNTIDNILKIWLNNSNKLFPLEKFGNYPFLIKLFQIMDYHFIYQNHFHQNKNLNQIDILIKSILKYEINQNQISLIIHLKHYILYQLIQLLIQPNLLNENFPLEILFNEETFIEQPNLNFIFKILNIFLDLIQDKSLFEQNQIDLIIEILFPQILINLLFDLFLLVSKHQIKIFILQLFSILIRTSEKFRLKKEIIYFLFKLLIEISSNCILTKHLQIAIMDLIFLLLMKEKNLQENHLPENIKNFFLVIHILNTLNDQTKRKLIPEEFFTQIDETKLTKENFEKTNDYFNNKSDEELIDYINTYLSFEKSFQNFIENLSNEFHPNSIYYEKYPHLSNISIDLIQIRSEFFYQLNIFIGKILPMIDLNLLSGESFLTDQIRQAKIYLFHQVKYELLNESLEKTLIKYSNEKIRVTFNIIKANQNNDNTMFYQAYQQLYPNAHIHFRKKLRQVWQAIYLGMHSIDQGGPYRDSITQICSDICSTKLSLFILCPNGRTNTGSNRDCWIPNVYPPNQTISDDIKKQYQFIGQLMGLAIRKKHYLDLKFPPLVWKQLLKESITIQDIQDIDIQSFISINEIEKIYEQTISTNNNNNDINDLFSSIISELKFEVVSSAGNIYELIPDGMNIPITSQNFKQYLFSYRQYRLNEFQRQIEFIHQGLSSVVPFYFLSFFTADELEQAVCGKQQIDIELLKRNTHYSGDDDQDSPHIQRFWTVIKDMFNDQQKKLFLTFVWGRNTLPSNDQDFIQKFTINEFSLDEDNIDKTLPQSHTCAFSIDLPAYSTTEIMYERLNYAITNCSSIDGDGTFNEERQTGNLFYDSDE